MKKCSKCNIEKTEDCFSKDKTSKDGFSYYCKECVKMQNKQWNQDNKELRTEKNKQWRENNKDRKAEYQKQWNQDNKKHVINYRKKYAINNPDKFKRIGERFFWTFAIKPLILERDNYCCQICGINKELQLHHILPIKHDDSEQHITNPKNLIILCSDCHLKAHDGDYKRLDMNLAKKLLDLVKAKEKIKKTELPEYKKV